MSSPRIYLDNAATSWPKSAAVLDAMDQYARHCGASAGRGVYSSAIEAGRVVSSVRREIARKINASSPSTISLHSSGTAALNAAIHGVLRPGDHVVTTAAEHNSVLRPLHFLSRHRSVRLTIVPCDAGGRVSVDQVMDAVNEKTRLVALTHASNVTGALQPIVAIGSMLKSHESFLLCDAAQTFGYLPLDVDSMCIDMLAAPGHKGGGGPAGTGFLYAHPRCHESIASFLQGGTGSQSESLQMPTAYPDKLEAGSLNVAALAGWTAGLREMPEPAEVAIRCRELAVRLHRGLANIGGLHVFGETAELPLASIAVAGLSPADLAGILDVEFRIETRAGLHCAALIHEHLGSGLSGTLRISGSPATTDQEIDAVIAALETTVSQLVS